MTYTERPPNAQCLTRTKSAILGLASPALVHSLSFAVAASSSAISIDSDARELPSDHRDKQEWQPSEKDASEREQNSTTPMGRRRPSRSESAAGNLWKYFNRGKGRKQAG